MARFDRYRDTFQVLSKNASLTREVILVGLTFFNSNNMDVEGLETAKKQLSIRLTYTKSCHFLCMKDPEHSRLHSVILTTAVKFH